MKTSRFLFVLCILLGLAVSAKSQGNQVERPFKGKFYSVVVEEYPAYEILSITGNATHLGLVINSEMTFIRPVPPPPLIGHLDGILKDKKGDYVHFDGSVNLNITDPATLSGTMSGTFSIDGGTGKFTGCYGGGQVTGTFSMTEDWAKWTVDGTITY
jgi:hypothetical protein